MRHKSFVGVILVGGQGTRLQSVVPDRPKALAPVRDRPFLAYLLDQLLEAGFARVVLSTGHLAEQVETLFGSNYQGMAVTHSREREPLGTAGAVRHALPHCTTDPVFVFNGDSYCQIDLNVFYEWHETRRAICSLALAYMEDTSRYGRVIVGDDGLIHAFHEKLANGSGAAGWVNGGIYILSHRVIQSIPTGCTISIERETFPAWVGKGLYGFTGEHAFLDIGTPESYAAARHFFNKTSC